AGGGSVGIGKTPGSYALDVNGNVNATAYYGSGANLTGITALPSGTTGQTLRNNGTTWVANSIIYNDGTNVGIGKTPGSYALDVNGNVNATAYYGSGANLTSLPPKGIIQVVQVNKTDTWSGGGSNYWFDIPGMSATITPSSTNNKILIYVNLGKYANLNGGTIRILRNGSTVPGMTADAAGSRIRGTFGFANPFAGDGNHAAALSFMYYDSPGSTSAQTYSLQSYTEGATTVVNRSVNDPDNTTAYASHSTSNIILMEFAP
ncbi:MAG: hypothetical protein WC475_00840, partial [Candidatus Paceibacterota bacterium]